MACSRCYFKDPNGQNLDVCVRNLLLKFQGDPTVNESGLRFYRSMFGEKTHFGELALAHTFELFLIGFLWCMGAIESL